jgi:membrane protein YdbS with pleckstrin-like domain
MATPAAFAGSRKNPFILQETMRTGKDILIRFQKRWQLMLWLEIFLYALGAAVFVAFIFQNLILSLIIFMLVGAVVMLTIRPWEIGVEYVSNYVDREVDTLEYSSGLLLVPAERS